MLSRAGLIPVLLRCPIPRESREWPEHPCPGLAVRAGPGSARVLAQIPADPAGHGCAREWLCGAESARPSRQSSRLFPSCPRRHPRLGSQPRGLSSGLASTDTAPSLAPGSPAPQGPPGSSVPELGDAASPREWDPQLPVLPGFLVSPPSCAGVPGSGRIQVARAGLGCGHGSVSILVVLPEQPQGLLCCFYPPVPRRNSQLPKSQSSALDSPVAPGCKSALSQAQDGSGGGRRGRGGSGVGAAALDTSLQQIHPEGREESSKGSPTVCQLVPNRPHLGLVGSWCCQAGKNPFPAAEWDGEGVDKASCQDPG